MLIFPEDSVSPYLCTVIIGGTKYGSGRGTSKKTAKRAAGDIHLYVCHGLILRPLYVSADSTLQLFLPDFHMHLNSVSKPDSQEKFQVLKIIDICTDNVFPYNIYISISVFV